MDNRYSAEIANLTAEIADNNNQHSADTANINSRLHDIEKGKISNIAITH